MFYEYKLFVCINNFTNLIIVINLFIRINIFCIIINKDNK